MTCSHQPTFIGWTLLHVLQAFLLTVSIKIIQYSHIQRAENKHLSQQISCTSVLWSRDLSFFGCIENNFLVFGLNMALYSCSHQTTARKWVKKMWAKKTWINKILKKTSLNKWIGHILFLSTAHFFTAEMFSSLKLMRRCFDSSFNSLFILQTQKLWLFLYKITQIGHFRL